jgi:anthranilate phosphoribosyltransferase
MLTDAIDHVLQRRDLGRERIFRVFEEVFAGRATDAQIAGLLIALRMKGETVEEVTGAAESLRLRARHVTAPRGRVVMDTCGTGGDGAGTFNVSTAVAFVAAAAGVVVAKHGNSRVSSRCGSADVLRAAGVTLEVSSSCVERCLAEVGVAFLLGPLANPARAGRQLLGVYDTALVPIVAGALAALGTERSLVVHGDDGLDEVSPSGPTRGILVENGRLAPVVISPEDAGLRRLGEAERGALSGGDPPENARLLRLVLSGQGPEALTDAVVVNSAAALWVAEVGKDLRECAEIAGRLLRGGAPLAKLDALARLTTESARDAEREAS